MSTTAMNTCYDLGTLRAHLDGELPDGLRAAVAAHVDACPACRRQLAELRQAAALARLSLDRVAAAQAPDVVSASARMQRREGIAPQSRFLTLRRLDMERKQIWRPVLAGVMVLALLVGTFSFAPSRALARQLLSVFRVNKFAVIEVSPDESTMNELGNILEGVFDREPEVVVDEPMVDVGSVEEASELAGFPVRMPGFLPPTDQTVEIEVKGRTEFRLAVPREAVEAAFALAGMDASALPAGMEEATIEMILPAVVDISNGHYQIVQAFEPQMIYPDGIDAQPFGEAGLRLMGLDADEARRISERIDWTSTLVLPIPTDVVEFRELEIHGHPGVLIEPRASSSGGQNTLMWEQDGIVYVINGPGSVETLVQIAESMF